MFICGIHALRLFRQKEATVIIFSKVSSKTAKTKIFIDLQKNWKNKLGKSGLFLLKFYIVQINTAAQLAFTSSKLKKETLEQGVKYVKS